MTKLLKHSLKSTNLEILHLQPKHKPRRNLIKQAQTVKSGYEIRYKYDTASIQKNFKNQDTIWL